MNIKKMAIFILILVAIDARGDWLSQRTDLITSQKIGIYKKEDSRQIVLVFMSTSCPCIKNNVDLLKEQINQYSKYFRFIGINVQNKNIKDTKKLYRKWNLGIPILLDRKDEIAKHFNVQTTGATIVLSATGVVVYAGGIVQENGQPLLSTALKQIQTTNRTEVAFNKGLGCIIDN